MTCISLLPGPVLFLVKCLGTQACNRKQRALSRKISTQRGAAFRLSSSWALWPPVPEWVTGGLWLNLTRSHPKCGPSRGSVVKTHLQQEPQDSNLGQEDPLGGHGKPLQFLPRIPWRGEAWRATAHKNSHGVGHDSIRTHPKCFSRLKEDLSIYGSATAREGKKIFFKYPHRKQPTCSTDWFQEVDMARRCWFRRVSGLKPDSHKPNTLTGVGESEQCGQKHHLRILSGACL